MKKIVPFILLMTGAILGNAKTYNKDSLVMDFRRYITLLEATHPDPYSGFGGKVFFHRAAREMERRLNGMKALTPEGLADSIMAFKSPLHDEHTFIYSSSGKSTASERSAFISWSVLPDKLIISGIDEKYKMCLGASLDSINGVALDKILKKVELLRGDENLYGQYLSLCILAYNEKFIKSLSSTPKYKDSVCYALTLPDGSRRAVMLPFLENKEYSTMKEASIPAWKNYPTGYLAYKFTDKERSTMLIHIPRIMARENYAWCLHQGWDNAYENIQSFFKNILKRELPPDTVKALAMIPSFSETFASCLQQMKKYDSQNLIIDLRGNGGGWTPITFPVLLMMYGDDFFRIKGMEYVTRISPLFLAKHKKTLEQWNEGNRTHYQIGDYIFENQDDSLSIEQKRKNFIRDCMSDTRSLLQHLQGRSLYRPKHVYVITDPETFSAAFHFAYYLRGLGATVVGVPSCQSPNTFMEMTPFTLPYSRLKGSISNSMQICFPANDSRSHIFWPDKMPSYDDYRHYHFDKHSEVLWLLDRIKSK